MKKKYQMPHSEVVTVAYSESLLDEASTIDVPGGGSGTPDDSRRHKGKWEDVEEFD